MKIRLAVVNPEMLAQVRAEIDMLRSAVDTGDLDGVDVTTAKLLALTVGCRSVDLSEEEWRVFLKRVRSGIPSFQSNYLLPGEVCAAIFPTVAASDFVLELPIDGEPEKEHADV
jgi:hypothetical protein